MGFFYVLIQNKKNIKIIFLALKIRMKRLVEYLLEAKKVMKGQGLRQISQTILFLTNHLKDFVQIEVFGLHVSEKNLY